MSATITLPEDLERMLERKAEAEGVNVEQFAVDVLRRVAEMPTISELVDDLNQERLDLLHPNQRWLQSHRNDYRGQWVVLYQGNLVAHGDDGEAITKTARAQGITEPFLAFIPTEDLPFAGF